MLSLEFAKNSKLYESKANKPPLFELKFIKKGIIQKRFSDASYWALARLILAATCPVLSLPC